MAHRPGKYCAFAGYAPPTFSVASAGSEIEGTARLVRRSGSTSLVVSVDGLEPGKAYASHLHNGTCAETTSPHYKDNPYGPSVPPNELWPSTEEQDAEAGLVADREGRAVAPAWGQWVARPTARSVWIHQGTVPGTPADEDHSAHIRIACADLSCSWCGCRATARGAGPGRGPR